jgi:SagB-type dehydrogenase family enzyme
VSGDGRERLEDPPLLARGTREEVAGLGEGALPKPSTRGRRSLEEVLAERRSIRRYRPRHLRPAEVGQLLWACQGRTDATGERTAPSAGALYPLELYAVLPGGLHRYLPTPHRLELIRGEDLRHALATAALDQEAVWSAPAVFVIAAVYERTAGIYGRRATRYVTLEAGHAAQDILLQAVALDLGAVPIGAFEDGSVRRTLGLPRNQHPLYLIPVGEPDHAADAQP